MAVPTNFTMTKTGSNTASSTWTNNQPAPGYSSIEVYRKVNGQSYSLIDTLAGSATSYNHTGLTSGTSYTAYVKGLPAGDSNEAGCTTDINDPSSLGATTANDTQIDLAWTNGESDYQNVEIWHSQLGYGWNLNKTISGSSTSTSVTGLNCGTTYSFKVKGLGTHINSNFSNTDSDTTQINDPTGFSASGAGTYNTLAWTNGSSYYQIDINRDGADIDTIAGSNTSYNDTSALINTHYTYKVRGKGYDLNSNYTSTASCGYFGDVIQSQ